MENPQLDNGKMAMNVGPSSLVGLPIGIWPSFYTPIFCSTILTMLNKEKETDRFQRRKERQ